MIRLIYWLMVVIEVVILLFTIFVFMITDSNTIKLATKEILDEHNITYAEISGNLITGIDITHLKHNNVEMVESVTLHWNPLALGENRINITRLEIERADPIAIMGLVSSFSSAEGEGGELDFDIDLSSVKVTAKPFSYQGVEFRDFKFGSESFVLEQALVMQAKYVTLSVDSGLVNLHLSGKVESNRFHFDTARLMEIDPKVITSFVRALRKEYRRDKNETVVVQESAMGDRNNSESSVLLDKILIDNFSATMKKTTYPPVTISNTKLSAIDVLIDPSQGFAYSAKEATASTETNFASTEQRGYIKDSMFYATGDIVTKDHLFDRYHLPLNRPALKRLHASLKVNHEGVWVEIAHDVERLLRLKKSRFNIDLKKLTHQLDYSYVTPFIRITSKGDGAMDYAKELNIENFVDIDFHGKNTVVEYYGTVQLNTLQNIPEHIATNLLQKTKARYKGTPSTLEVDIESKDIEGRFLTEGYEKATLQLAGKKPIKLAQLVKNVPDELREASGKLTSHSELDLLQSEKSQISVDYDSDIANLTASIGLREPYRVLYQGSVPEQSWLYRLDERLKVGSLGVLSGEVVLYPDYYGIVFQSDELSLQCEYLEASGDLRKGVIRAGDEVMNFSGDFDKQFQLSSSLKEVEPVMDLFKRYYKLEIAPLQGAADITLKKLENGDLSVQVTSPNLRYDFLRGDVVATIGMDKANRIKITAKSNQPTYDDHNGTTQALENFSGEVLLDGDAIIVSRYRVRVKDNEYIRELFASHPSYLEYRDGLLTMKKVWVNDQVKVSGDYHIETQSGDLVIDANRFDYKSDDFDISSRLGLKLKANDGEYFFTGKIQLLDAKSTYEVLGSGVSEDSDIIIVQEERQKSESALNKIKSYVTIENKNPVSYISKDINIQFATDIYLAKGTATGSEHIFFKPAWNKKLKKRNSTSDNDFQLVGKVDILDGYYQQEDKRFHLDGSTIYFYGDPAKPLLEIRATYQKEQYDIQIFITGSADDPVINFNSNPYLTQKEILSLILFDATTSSSGTGSNTELYAMLGGTFAKELMKSLGLNVDHLLLGEGIDESLSVEVGRKISDNITVIYQHENGRDGVKLRVDHSDNFETDIIIRPPDSSSIEFLYKSD